MAAAPSPSTGLEILFVADALPTHLGDGGRIRSYHFISGLSQRGYVIDVLGFVDASRPGSVSSDIGAVCRSVEGVPLDDLDFVQRKHIGQLRDTVAGALRGFPRRAWQFHSPRMLRAIARAVSAHRYDLIQVYGLGATECLMSLDGVLSMPRVLDFMDALSLFVRSSLRHRVDETWPIRLIESWQLRAYEATLLRRVDAAIISSPVDREYFGNPSKLHVVPNVVKVPPLRDVPKDYDVIFVGNMALKPNIDAVMQFAEQVWPRILAARPDAVFAIVGRDPAAAVRQLAGPNVIVTGQVDDLGAQYSRAKVSIAPVRYGTGTKNKVLESCAYALPVVCTPVANQGLNAVDGESIVLCERPEAMAEAILGLLADARRRERIGAAAREFVIRSFSLDHAIDLLDGVYRSVIRQRV
jgi:glycosyltransferase involved in cell wall biosynthesis